MGTSLAEADAEQKKKAAATQGVRFTEAEEARLNAEAEEARLNIERKACQAAERKAEAERHAKAETARKAAEAEAALKAEAARLLADAEARAQDESTAKAAADTASSSHNQGIFIQLPSLDDLSAKVDATTDAQVKLVDSLKEAQTSINNTIFSNKPDLSFVTNEIRSLFQAQATKINE